MVLFGKGKAKKATCAVFSEELEDREFLIHFIVFLAHISS